MQKNITITHDNTSLCNLPKEGPRFGKLARETCDKSSRRLDYRPKKHNAGSSGRRCLHRKFGEGPEEDPHQRSRKGQEGKSTKRKASENSRRTWQVHAMGPARRMRARQKGGVWLHRRIWRPNPIGQVRQAVLAVCVGWVGM